MKIVWSKTADKPFSKIDNRYKSRIKSRLEKMDDKASSISDIKKLSSPENHYRLRLGDSPTSFSAASAVSSDITPVPFVNKMLILCF